jgi:hypothetical protein
MQSGQEISRHIKHAMQSPTEGLADHDWSDDGFPFRYSTPAKSRVGNLVRTPPSHVSRNFEELRGGGGCDWLQSLR